MEIDPPEVLKRPLNVPKRNLMGPGPSNCSPRVLEAMGKDVLGHLHPEVLKAIDEIKEGIRYLFQTKNELTLAITGSGHAGMETLFVNLLEPGDKAVICCNGVWGLKAYDLTKRMGVMGIPISPPLGLGDNFPLDYLESVIQKNKPKLLFIVQGESSTGVYQPLEGLGDICERYNCLLAVDIVASLCGVPFFMDKWKIDAAYAGSQKVLGVPPGITPLSFSPKAEKVIFSRRTPITSYFWDVTALGSHWNCFKDVRTYHHTICSTMLFALRESLAQITEEGLINIQKRHKECAQQFYDGLKMLGLECFVEDPDKRLPTVTTIKLSDKWCWKEVISYAFRNFNTDISGGMGPTVGKVLRVGIMGYNATPDKVNNVLLVLGKSITHAESKKTAKL